MRHLEHIKFKGNSRMGWSFAPSEWPTTVTFVAVLCAAMVFLTAAKIVVAVLRYKQDQRCSSCSRWFKPTYLACSFANPSWHSTEEPTPGNSVGSKGLKTKLTSVAMAWL